MFMYLYLTHEVLSLSNEDLTNTLLFRNLIPSLDRDLLHHNW
jgi:hypothetical protein